MIEYIKFWLAKGLTEMAIGLAVFFGFIVFVFLAYPVIQWIDRREKKRRGWE